MFICPPLYSIVFAEENDCIYDDTPVRLTDPGRADIDREGIQPITLYDMIMYHAPPNPAKDYKFRKSSVELHANHADKMYRIILDLNTNRDGSNVYLISHVKPYD